MSRIMHDYQPITHPLIIRNGMKVRISASAARQHNSRRLPDDTGRAGFNDRPVSCFRDYEIVNRIGSSCELKDTVTGQAGVWFNVHDLIYIIHYQGYLIQGKITPFIFHSRTPTEYPYAAEVYTPSGDYVGVYFDAAGLWASVGQAIKGIRSIKEADAIAAYEQRQHEAYIASLTDPQFAHIGSHDAYLTESVDDDDPDWHEQEAWGREDY